MAGTDRNIPSPENLPRPPAVILVRPQLGENIGMCARAMLNCAVTELRLVAPRDGWPNPAAVAAASGAASVLDGAKVFATTAEAVADLPFVLATTARPRDMVKEIFTASEAAGKIRALHAAGTGCGLLFGPERAGLENADVALASAILNIPLNPGFSSLNLAQAVLLACHAWLTAENVFAPARTDPQAATKGEIVILMAHLEDELEKHGFFRSPEKRPAMVMSILNFFSRSGATPQDIQTFHGIFSCLTGKRSWK